MPISVLDRTGQPIQRPTLGMLHDHAGQVDHELLPCRINNPELWFAESPTDVSREITESRGKYTCAMRLLREYSVSPARSRTATRWERILLASLPRSAFRSAL